MAERRRAKRLKRRLLVRYGETEFDHAAMTRDLSTGGAGIISRHLPKLNTRLHVRLDLGGGNHRYFEAVVRWRKQSPQRGPIKAWSGFGVRFLQPEEVYGHLIGQGVELDEVAEAPEAFRFVCDRREVLVGLYQRELSRGGIVVPASLAGDAQLSVESEALVVLELEFLATPTELTLPAKVLQVFPTSTEAGAGQAIALVFLDPGAVVREVEGILGPMR
jgi:hypothetical protein